MTLLAHSRLVISGTIGASQSWSTGIGLTGTDESAPDAPTLKRFVDLFAPLVATWFTGCVSPMNASDVSVTHLTLTSYVAGSTKAHAVAEHVYAPVLVGNSAGAQQPTYVSLVATLLTGIPGRSGRGRMYLPMTAATLAEHQTFSLATTDVPQKTATLFAAMAVAETTGQPQLLPAVCGKTGNFPITSVKCDSLPDVQHRREDKIGAKFTNVAVV